jgi:hypothetical protein
VLVLQRWRGAGARVRRRCSRVAASVGGGGGSGGGGDDAAPVEVLHEVVKAAEEIANTAEVRGSQRPSGTRTLAHTWIGFTRPAGHPSSGVPPAVERQLHLLTGFTRTSCGRSPAPIASRTTQQSPFQVSGAAAAAQPQV